MRRDIQFLRGVAVLLVVLYHAAIGVFRHGYLGVDVFFVLSGFLITRIILEGLEKGSFSFLNFYLRRAKRLLPALYTTLLATTVIAGLILTPNERKDFAAQLIGSLAFAANMVLPTQIGYFAAQAEGVPLLHIWSLSLEEQYYFTLPLFLLLIPGRWQLLALLAALAASLAWCLSWVTDAGVPPYLWRLGNTPRNEWAFFLFPTRAWELLAGSICAWLMLHNKAFVIPSAVKWIALIAILVVSLWGLDSVHPRGDALIVVVATALLVLGNDQWLPRSISISAIERIGDWSYSIYLVHWPLFVAAYVTFLEQVPLSMKAMLVIASITAGYLQYRYVETPFRYQWQRPARSVWRKIALASIVLLAVPLSLLATTSKDSLENDRIREIRKINYGLSEKCDGAFAGERPKKECSHGHTPRIAVWGDSYAMHLVPGLLSGNPDLVQLTMSVCGPIIGLAPVFGRYNEAWARNCLLHNEKALAFIKNSRDITHVVLSSSFSQYFDAKEGKFLVAGELVDKNAGMARAYLTETLEEIRRAGKEPILVSPPPRSGFNIGACLERQDRRLFYLRDGCDINRNEYIEHESGIIAALSKIGTDTDIRLVWLSDLFCEANRCPTRSMGTYLYRDGGHLSVAGAGVLLGDWIVGNEPPYLKRQETETTGNNSTKFN